MKRSCVFCDIIKGDTPAYKVYEDDSVLAFLDIYPSAPGHTLIIPKEHVASVEDLSEEASAALFSVLHNLVGKIQVAVSAPASTIGINNGPEGGQEIPHIHLHVIPRFSGDRGGIIQGIVRSGGRPKKEEMRRIAQDIQKLVYKEK